MTLHESLALCPCPPPLFLSQGLPPLALTSHHQHRQLLTVLWSCTPPLKLAAVTPALKKPGLDTDIPNNYRPLSNLPYLSKVLERAVGSQLKSYLNLHNLYEPFQSGFRSKHS